MVAVTAIMLALPLTIAILGFLPKWATSGGVADPAALRQALEAASERALGGSPAVPEVETRILAPDPAKLAKAITALATDAGGIAISEEGEDQAMRMVVSVPADREPEFLRRLGLLTGVEHASRADGRGLMVLLLRPQAKP